jgi:hypothetical protein
MSPIIARLPPAVSSYRFEAEGYGREEAAGGRGTIERRRYSRRYEGKNGEEWSVLALCAR